MRSVASMPPVDLIITALRNSERQPHPSRPSARALRLCRQPLLHPSRSTTHLPRTLRPRHRSNLPPHPPVVRRAAQTAPSSSKPARTRGAATIRTDANRPAAASGSVCPWCPWDAARGVGGIATMWIAIPTPDVTICRPTARVSAAERGTTPDR